MCVCECVCACVCVCVCARAHVCVCLSNVKYKLTTHIPYCVISARLFFSLNKKNLKYTQLGIRKKKQIQTNTKNYKKTHTHTTKQEQAITGSTLMHIVHTVCLFFCNECHDKNDLRVLIHFLPFFLVNMVWHTNILARGLGSLTWMNYLSVFTPF